MAKRKLERQLGGEGGNSGNKSGIMAVAWYAPVGWCRFIVACNPPVCSQWLTADGRAEKRAPHSFGGAVRLTGSGSIFNH